MALTELSEPTVRLWFDTFRHQLPEEETILDHLVQLDEAYFGGKKKTTTLFMAKQVSSLGERKLAYQLIKGGYPKREHAWWFVETYLKPYTALFTDGASIYKEIDQWWPLYHSRDIQKSLSLSRLQRLKGCLGYYELSLEECIIMLPMTSYRLLWVNSVTDLAIQKCLKIRDTMQKYHLSL